MPIGKDLVITGTTRCTATEVRYGTFVPKVVNIRDNAIPDVLSNDVVVDLGRSVVVKE